MAGSTSSIRAGRAFVELFADDSRLVRGLRRAEGRLKAFGDRVRTLGLAVTGAVAAVAAPLGVLTVRAAADAEETTSRFEQVFQDQAAAAGRFADDLARSIGRSRYAIRDALATFQSFFVGLGFAPGEARELSQSLQQLALDFASFHNLSDAEALERFIAGLSGSSEVFDRFGINIKQAALEQQLLAMGVRKSWSEVSEQEKAIARLNVVAQAMGEQGAIGDAARTAGSFTNRMKTLRGQVHDTAVAIGQALLPVVTPLVAQAAALARAFAGWAKENQTLIATAFKLAAGVALVGGALIGLGLAVSLAGFALGGLATIASAVAAGLGLVGTALAALVSPVGLAVAAVGALGAALLQASGIGAAALAWLGEKFGVLQDEAMAAVRGIADALAAGDLGLAARVLWLTLRLQWQKGISALKAAWLGLEQFFVQLAHDAFYGALAAFEFAWHGLEVAFIETTAFLTRAWTRFTAGFTKAWNTAITWTAKRLLELQGLFDSSLDVDAAQALADRELEATNRRIDAERERALGQAEHQRQQRREQARQAHEGALGAIGRQYEDARERLQGEYDAQRRRSEEALAHARREWEQALAEATRQRRAAEREGEGPEGLPSPDEFLKGLDLGGLGQALDDAVRRAVDVRGTFNAAAVQGLAAASDADERTAKATEETARYARRLTQQAQSGGLTFT